MYSRNFFKEDAELPRPPENYGGTAIGEEDRAMQAEFTASTECECIKEPESICSADGCGGHHNFCEKNKGCDPCQENHGNRHGNFCENFGRRPDPCQENSGCGSEKREGGGGLFGGLFGGGSLFGGGALSSLFSSGGVKSFISKIGTEEILIIATALFLFLSKEGDKECAIMLLLLLLV